MKTLTWKDSNETEHFLPLEYLTVIRPSSRYKYEGLIFVSQQQQKESKGRY